MFRQITYKQQQWQYYTLLKPMNNDFFSKYSQNHILGLPKYAQLREALRTAIEDGHWKPGDKLPPEAVIATITPFSLGTVQKALRALVKEGVVERRQGSGTFVSGKRSQMYDPWHFRFSKGDCEDFMPVYPKVLRKKVITVQSSWARLINQQSDKIIKIDRIVGIGDQFSMFSKFYIAFEKYHGFLSKSLKELESINFKTILRMEYNLSIPYLNHTLQLIVFPREISKAINVPDGTSGILLKIMAISATKKAVYYQEVYVPPNDLNLHISDSAFIPECWV